VADWTNTVVAIVAAIIGLATLSVILSKSAQTSSVISASTTGLGNLIKTAVSPISGFSGVSTAIEPLQA
jgi:uncharacterized membrane protein (Fun14 family)